MGRVEGKVVIITGAASGLGEADAELLVREGAQVIVADIDEANGKAVAERIGALFVRHDVTSEQGWDELVDMAINRFGKLDALVNNAATTKSSNIENCSLEEFQFINRVNADGTFLGCRAAIRAIKQNPAGGSIVNMASLAALRGFPEVFAYTASKGAVRAMTMNVAAYCLKAGLPIRCNSVFPGSTLTPMQQRSEAARQNEAATGMDRSRQRMGKPVDIANLVLYLTSDESVHVTGQEFIVDGGYSIL